MDEPGAAAQARVCAALVTYNRKELLVECLDALLTQTHPVKRIVLADNASTDGTRELLRERGLLDDERIAYEPLETNLGSSGGFAHAVDVARATGADWIWVMDDDAEPRPDALERLLASPYAGDPGTAVLCQKPVNPDGSVQMGARGFFRGHPVALAPEEHVSGTELDFTTFVGMLVRGDTARATDPPKAEMFIWCDDYEWCFRLRERGAIRLVAESEIVHKDAGHGFSNRRMAIVNRVTGWGYGATPYSGFWRNIAGVRNWVWIKKTYLGEGPLGAVWTVTQFVAKALLYDERPFARVPWILRAALDGRRGVFQNITPREWAERLRREAGAPSR